MERMVRIRLADQGSTLANMDLPLVDIHVYLDTNVLIDYWAAMNDQWDPADDLTHTSNVQRINAARLLFYGYTGRTPPGSSAPWYLVTSTKAREEMARRPGPDIISVLLQEVDLTSDAPDLVTVAEAADRLMTVTAITDRDDAIHLAEVQLRPWIRYIVTSDKKFRNRSTSADIDHLKMISVECAIELLAIAPGEKPPIAIRDRPWPEWLIPVETSPDVVE